MSKTKENIIVGASIGLGIGLIILVGIIVLDNVGYEVGFVEGYCVDREGMQDIKHLNLSFWEEDIINCTHCKKGCITSAVARTG